MSQKINRVGEINCNTYKNIMKIVEYNNNSNIVVEFKNGYRVKTRYDNFKKGTVKSPYDKTLYDTGYIGEGQYKTKVNNKVTIQFKYWKNMLRRCYDESYLLEKPTYKQCEVCEEWHNFQTFAKWFDENYYEVDGQKIELDKDIICKGNKIYSPETCVFVPQRINILFSKANAIRGKYPIGVSYYNKYKKFNSYCNVILKTTNRSCKKNLGYFDTPEEAFYKYKEFKEKYIKEIAKEYKDMIPVKLYEAMNKYVVEIDD